MLESEWNEEKRKEAEFSEEVEIQHLAKGRELQTHKVGDAVTTEAKCFIGYVGNEFRFRLYLTPSEDKLSKLIALADADEEDRHVLVIFLNEGRFSIAKAEVKLSEMFHKIDDKDKLIGLVYEGALPMSIQSYRQIRTWIVGGNW